MSTNKPAKKLHEDRYLIEDVVAVRTRNGAKEYLLKWKGFPDEENSWVPEENFDSPDVARHFDLALRNRKTTKAKTPTSKQLVAKKKAKNDEDYVPNIPLLRKRTRAKRSQSDDESSHATVNTQAVTPTKTSRQLVAEEILTVTKKGEEILFLVKWFGRDEADLVTATQMKHFYPKMVAEFYQKRVVLQKIADVKHKEQLQRRLHL